MQRRAPRSEFLIARGHQRAAVAREFVVSRDEAREKVLDARTRGEFYKFLRDAGDFLEAAKEKNLYPDARCY
jgi:hypothetical protein